MSTDLFGKPLAGYPQYTLSLHQKRQATLLYHWMSLDYLRGLKTLIDSLIKGADVTVELAKMQGRDQILTNDRWGVRDTAANWSTFVFPALEDFRKSTIWQIAQVANEVYGNTGANQCAHMINEFSSLWMTQEEEERFKGQWEEVGRYADKIDQSAGLGEHRPLDDSTMAVYWSEAAVQFPRLPKLRVRTDVEGATGQRPPRTGVYVPQDDPNGTLQFAWTGDNAGQLGKEKTFNALGLRLLGTIGRNALWLDQAKMTDYAIDAFRKGELTDYCGLGPGDERDPDGAWAILSQQSFTTRPCKWYFVEMIDGEFDDEADVASVAGSETVAARLRCEAGNPCPSEGFWFTPAQAGSRRFFKAGEVMPGLGGDYGATIWQWDKDQ